MTRAHRFAVASALLAAAIAVAPRAGAAGGSGRVDKKTCIASSESGQKLRHDGKLRAARDQLLVCARPECPTVIRQDCAQFLNEVTTSTPSVVIAARDTNGKETLSVKVTIDGEVALTRLDGKAYSVDPGVHVFKYEAEDGSVQQEDVGIREGEKNRVLYVSFHKADPEAPPAPMTATIKTPAPTPTTAPPVTTTTTTTKPGIPTGAFVFGGIGLLGVGLGTFFLVTAGSDASNLRSTCAPSCSHTDVSAARNKALLGDVAIAVGGVSLIAAVWMALSKPGTERVVQTTGSLRVDVLPTLGGAAMGLRGAF
jgi:hypothetical protein